MDPSLLTLAGPSTYQQAEYTYPSTSQPVGGSPSSSSLSPGAKSGFDLDGVGGSGMYGATALAGPAHGQRHPGSGDGQRYGQDYGSGHGNGTEPGPARGSMNPSLANSPISSSSQPSHPTHAQYQDRSPPSGPASGPLVSAHQELDKFLESFWTRQMGNVEREEQDGSNGGKGLVTLPLARIKKVMKSDEDVKVR